MEGDSSKVGEGSATDLFLFALVFFTVFLLEEPLGVACPSYREVAATGSLIEMSLEALFSALAIGFFFLELDAAAVTLLPHLEATFSGAGMLFAFAFNQADGWRLL